MKPNRVTHCICYKRTLQGIADEAQAKGIGTVREVVQKMNVCDMCKRCIPYLRALLEDKRGL